MRVLRRSSGLGKSLHWVEVFLRGIHIQCSAAYVLDMIESFRLACLHTLLGGLVFDLRQDDEMKLFYIIPRASHFNSSGLQWRTTCSLALFPVAGIRSGA